MFHAARPKDHCAGATHLHRLAGAPASCRIPVFHVDYNGIRRGLQEDYEKPPILSNGWFSFDQNSRFREKGPPPLPVFFLQIAPDGIIIRTEGRDSL